MTVYYNGKEVLSIRPDGLCAGCTHLREPDGRRPFKAKWSITCADLLGRGPVHYCGYCRNRVYWIVHDYDLDGEIFAAYDWTEARL